MDDRIVFCPLVEAKIENIDCIEVRDVVNGAIKETFISEDYKKKENWKDLCKGCKWHNY